MVYNRIKKYLLRNLNHTVLIQKKSSALFDVIVGVLVVVAPLLILMNTVNGGSLWEIFVVAASEVLVVAALVLICRGHYTWALVVFGLSSSTALWVVLCFGPRKGILLERLDTISVALALFTMIPLVVKRSRNWIYFFLGYNYLWLLFFLYRLHSVFGLSPMAVLEYGMDNTIAMAIIGFIAFRTFSMNETALESLQEELDRNQETKKQLVQSNTRLMKIYNQLWSETEKLGLILKSMSDGVITTDSRGNIDLTNRAAEEITEMSFQEMAGRSMDELFVAVSDSGEELPDYYSSVLSEKRSLSVPRGRIRRNFREDSYFDAQFTAVPVLDQDETIRGSLLVFRDITEALRMEEEMIKSSQMESLGLFAGGIAHDFNNYLMGIIGNLSLARLDLNPGSDIEPLLRDAQTMSDRAAELTSQLLTFARGGEPVRRAHDLEGVVQENLDLISIGSSVKFDSEIPDDLYLVNGDSAQISRVIHNLLINARQAIEPRSGRVRVGAQNGETVADGLDPLIREPHIHLTIEDDGPGIPQENLNRVFDPFYTTKADGSGLGLSVVYSIVKRHGGRIVVETPPGGGTRFTMTLPALDRRLSPESVRPAAQNVPAKKILVMDDEPLVGQAAVRLLESLGHEVFLAVDGSAALDLFREALESSFPFDLVLMDLTVPGGMGGKELIRHLRALHPEIPAVVSSGYNTDPVMANYRSYGFSDRIPKPYHREDLEYLLARVFLGDPRGPVRRDS